MHPDNYFGVAVNSFGESAHARLRTISAAEFEELGRAVRN